MKAQTLNEVPETAERHRLLGASRDSSVEETLPEPTWILRDKGETVVLWPPEQAALDRPTLVLQQPDRPQWELVLALWKRYRDLSPLEKALVVSTLEEPSEDRHRLADQLELPASEPLFDALSNIETFPEPLREKLHDEELSLRLIRYVHQLPGVIKNSVVNGLMDGSVQFSVQELRKLEEAVRRLSDSKRETWKTRYENLLKRDEHPRETGREILAMTRELAYPRTMERRKKFEDTLEAIDPDGRITVTPPDNFEGDYLEFKVRCRRDENLIKLSEELKRCKKLLKHL